jgi:hypothetical protein
LYSEYPAKEGHEGFGDFMKGGKEIHPVKYADGLSQVAK